MMARATAAAAVLVALVAVSAAQGVTTGPIAAPKPPTSGVTTGPITAPRPPSGVTTGPITVVPTKCTPGAVCRKATKICELDGVFAANCACLPNQPAGDDKVCRAARGPCDAEEYCNGITFDCPADYRQELGDICRPAKGDCDLPEACDGKGDICPATDKFKGVGAACNFVYRNGTNECPLLSTCSGSTSTCPGNQYCGCQPGWISTERKEESICFDKFAFRAGASQTCNLRSGWVIPPRKGYTPQFKVEAHSGSACAATTKVGTGSISCRPDGGLVISLRRLESGRTIFSRLRAYVACQPPQGCSINELTYVSLNQRDVTVAPGVVRGLDSKCLCADGKTPYIMMYADVATVCPSVPVTVIPLRR